MLMMIKQLFFALVWSITGRPSEYPQGSVIPVTLTAAAGAWTWGAWAQIIAAATVTAETQITGVSMSAIVAAPNTQGEVQIGTGGAGAEVAIATVPIADPNYDFPYGVRIPPTTRIAARLRTSTGAADTVDAKVLTETGV